MRTVLFLCPHNAAKSVMAESLFNAGAADRGLGWRAASAGTEPSKEVSPAVVDLLKKRSLPAPAHDPRKVTPEEFGQADRVISLGCQAGELPGPLRQFEMWDEVPVPSTDLAASFAVIASSVDDLLRQLSES